VPMFLFHEGYDPVAAMGFKQLAQLTRGAYCRFDSNSAQQLKELLSAVAVYAAGGRQALENFNKRHGKTVLQLTQRK
jgi:ABC-type sulfate transport system substrate-binding protein